MVLGHGLLVAFLSAQTTGWAGMWVPLGASMRAGAFLITAAAGPSGTLARDAYQIAHRFRAVGTSLA